MRYWNRNLISTTKRPPTVNDASGVFDLTSHQVYKGNGIWPALVNDGLTTDGLYLHLDAGNSDSYPGSGTTWFDLTSNDLDFTLLNGTLYNSGFDGNFAFDGSNDKAKISSGWTSFGADPFTIEAWFRVHTTGVAEALVSTQGGGNGTFQVAQNNSGYLVINATTTSGTGEGVTATSALSLNTWQQTVMVREGTGTNQFKIYKNGSLDATGTCTANLNSTAQIRIGNNRNGNHYFDGNIAIIRIYKNKALSAAEVIENYNNNRSRYSLPAVGVITDSLILHLDAGNSSSYGGSGTTWTDLSGNSNNGTLTNGPTFDSNNQGSIVFDGSDDYVNLGTQINSDIANTDVTISFWAYIDSTANDEVFVAMSDLQTSRPLVIWYDSSVFAGSVDNDGTGDVGAGTTNAITVMVTSTGSNEHRFATGNNVLTANTWHNIAVVLDVTNNAFYTYIDGVEQAKWVSDNTSTGIMSSTNGFRIGGGFPYLDGRIAHFLAYTKALSASEVLTNYNRLKDRYS